MSQLLAKTALGNLPLQNHLVMSPMTRSRAIGNVPNELMAQYYGQRASVGLVITEGTSPSPDGLGYPRIPGAYSPEQTAGWARIARSVHLSGAKFFIQLMHCGRVAHPLNLPAGARVVAPSAIPAADKMYTDSKGFQPLPTPTEMTVKDIEKAIDEFVVSARNTVSAGGDGVELHGANGYLLEQFLRPNSNTRTDAYGGPIENRARFVLAVVDAVGNAIGRQKVGIRLSPYGIFNDMPIYPAMAHDYSYLARTLSASGIAYVHLVDHAAMGAPPVPVEIKREFRRSFKRTLILSGGYDAKRAEQDLTEKHADLIAVGRPLLANPDLIARWQKNAPLNAPDESTFYTPGPKGYTDYASRP